MPYDPALDERVSALLAGEPGLSQKKMFGGVAYLVHGNMACGVLHDYLIVRLDKVQAETALRQPHIRPFDLTGKPMTGWIEVHSPGLNTGADLRIWLDAALRFARTLPPK